MIITRNLRLPKEKYFEIHLSLINPLLPVTLTPKEIEVLARFMALEGDIATDRFGTSAKKIIKQELNLTDGGLSNYMGSLKRKTVLYINPAGVLTIQPAMLCDDTEQQYQFKLQNQDK